MVGKWRILRSPLITSADSATRIVRCTTQPHNCCIDKGHTVPSTPSEDPCKLLPPEHRTHSGHALRGKPVLRESGTLSQTILNILLEILTNKSFVLLVICVVGQSAFVAVNSNEQQTPSHLGFECECTQIFAVLNVADCNQNSDLQIGSTESAINQQLFFSDPLLLSFAIATTMIFATTRHHNCNHLCDVFLVISPTPLPCCLTDWKR